MKSCIFDAGDCCYLNQSFTSIGQLANSAMISSSSFIAIELKILFCNVSSFVAASAARALEEN